VRSDASPEICFAILISSWTASDSYGTCTLFHQTQCYSILFSASLILVDDRLFFTPCASDSQLHTFSVFASYISQSQIFKVQKCSKPCRLVFGAIAPWSLRVAHSELGFSIPKPHDSAQNPSSLGFLRHSVPDYQYNVDNSFSPMVLTISFFTKIQLLFRLPLSNSINTPPWRVSANRA
jgi:hypothetical protein